MDRIVGIDEDESPTNYSIRRPEIIPTRQRALTRPEREQIMHDGLMYKAKSAHGGPDKLHTMTEKHTYPGTVNLRLKCSARPEMTYA